MYARGERLASMLRCSQLPHMRQPVRKLVLHIGNYSIFLNFRSDNTQRYVRSHLYGVKGTGDCGRARETETARARDFHDFNDAVVCKRAVDQHSTGAVDCPDHVRVTGCQGSDPQRDEQSHGRSVQVLVGTLRVLQVRSHRVVAPVAPF